MNKAVLIAAPLVLCAGLSAALLVSRTGNESANDNSKSGLVIDYASDVVPIVDEESARRAAEQEEQLDGVPVEFKGTAVSADGETFACHLANPTYSKYDEFLVIFESGNEEEPLYLSGLLRPGTALESVTLNKKLDPGTHELSVAFSQVDVVDGQQVLRQQVVIALDFVVQG